MALGDADDPFCMFDSATGDAGGPLGAAAEIGLGFEPCTAATMTGDATGALADLLVLSRRLSFPSGIPEG